MPQRSEMRRYGSQTSPERTKVWIEPPPKYHYQQQLQQQQQQQGMKVPVVYYLCKNRHLEHPHFIEVPLSSSDGLYLRDVINRLNVLRGKGMAPMYSWSCKRSYKNGFVWHDLAEDDLILPAQGNEYVLKGSELLDQSPIERHRHGLSNAKIHHDKHHKQDSPVSCKPDEASTSSSPTTVATDVEKIPPPSTPPPQLESIRARPVPVAREDESSPSTQRSGSSGEFNTEPIHMPAPLSTVNSESALVYRNCSSGVAQDASTQTECRGSTVDVVDTRIIGVSTDDGLSDVECKESQREPIPESKLVPEIVIEERSPPPTASSASSSCGRTNTLESLIRDEVSKRNSFRIEEEVFIPTRAKLKATNMLMQLISCGSIAVKDHYSFGFVPTYRPRFNNVKFPSPLISDSIVLGEIDYLSESQRVMGLRLQEKENFTGSVIEAKKFDQMVDGVSVLNQSSSFDENRSLKVPNSKRDKDKSMDVIQSRCLPRTMNNASCKHSKDSMNETTMSPVHDIRMSLASLASCKSSPLSSSKVGSKRIIDSSSVKGQSMRFESFREEKEKVIKIEESLLLALGL